MRKLFLPILLLAACCVGCNDQRLLRKVDGRYADFNFKGEVNVFVDGDSKARTTTSFKLDFELTRVGAYAVVVPGRDSMDKFTSTATGGGTAHVEVQNVDAKQVYVYYSDGKTIERTVIKLDE